MFLYFSSCTRRTTRGCQRSISCVWAILALLPVGQSRTTVVVIAPGMLGSFKVLYQLDQSVESNCDQLVLGLSSCLISVVQGDPISDGSSSVRRTTFVTSVLYSRHYGDNYSRVDDFSRHILIAHHVDSTYTCSPDCLCCYQLCSNLFLLSR